MIKYESLDFYMLQQFIDTINFKNIWNSIWVAIHGLYRIILSLSMWSMIDRFFIKGSSCQYNENQEDCIMRVVCYWTAPFLFHFFFLLFENKFGELWLFIRGKCGCCIIRLMCRRTTLPRNGRLTWETEQR